MPTQPIRERLRGIHAATVTPLTAAFAVDEAALADHVAPLARTPGIRGLLVNGHAGENFTLPRGEKAKALGIVREAVPADCLIVAGVNAESSLDAADQARDAEALGADAILVFPPNSWALTQDPDVILTHHRIVETATGLPILLYQAPVGAGRMAYAKGVIEALIASPRVVGVKEGSWEIATYEENARLIRARRPDIAVLGSGDEHLLTSYLIGTDGSQVSLAAVVPEQIVALFAAAEAKDWARARAIHEALYPLAAAVYRRAPTGRATARLKTCLKLLGRLASDRVCPPMVSPSPAEIAELEAALAVARAA